MNGGIGGYIGGRQGDDGHRRRNGGSLEGEGDAQRPLFKGGDRRNVDATGNGRGVVVVVGRERGKSVSDDAVRVQKAAE